MQTMPQLIQTINDLRETIQSLHSKIKQLTDVNPLKLLIIIIPKDTIWSIWYILSNWYYFFHAKRMFSDAFLNSMVENCELQMNSSHSFKSKHCSLSFSCTITTISHMSQYFSLYNVPFPYSIYIISTLILFSLTLLLVLYTG